MNQLIFFPSLILLMAGLALKALGYDRPLAILPQFGVLSVVNDQAVVVIPADHLNNPRVLAAACAIHRVVPLLVADPAEMEMRGLDRWLESQR